MKFTVRPSALASALSLVSRATSAKSTLPVLSNVLLSVEGDTLSLSTTNLEIALTHWIPIEQGKPGAITVPVKLLTEYVALVRGESLTATLTEQATLHLDAKGSTTDIKGIAAEEFPLLPEVAPTSTFQLPSGALVETISQTVFACAVSDTRPVLAGTYFHVESEQVKVVATDSYRLAEKTLALLSPATPISFIVPVRTISELGRILPRYDDAVAIHVAKNQVLFELPDLRLVSRLIEGQFPPYEKIIPTTWGSKITLDVEDFLTTVRRSSLFVREGVNSVKFRVLPKTNALEVVALSEQVGGETATLTGSVEGEEVEVAFNAQYLIDALANIGAREVSFELQTAERPGVLRSTESDDYLHVIMPLKL